MLRPSDLIPKIELPNLEVPDVGAVFADGFPMYNQTYLSLLKVFFLDTVLWITIFPLPPRLPPGFGKVEIPRVDLSIFGRFSKQIFYFGPTTYIENSFPFGLTCLFAGLPQRRVRIVELSVRFFHSC